MPVFHGQTVGALEDCEDATLATLQSPFQWYLENGYTFPSTDYAYEGLGSLLIDFKAADSGALALWPQTSWLESSGTIRLAWALKPVMSSDIANGHSLWMLSDYPNWNNKASIIMGLGTVADTVRLAVNFNGGSFSVTPNIPKDHWIWIACRLNLNGTSYVTFYDATTKTVLLAASGANTSSAWAEMYWGSDTGVSEGTTCKVYIDDIVVDQDATKAAPDILGWSLGITAAGISSASAVGSPNLQAIISTLGIASAQAMGSQILSASLICAGIESGEIFGLPIIGSQGIIGAGGMVSGEILGQPALSARLGAVGIASLEAFGLPILGAIIASNAPPVAMIIFDMLDIDIVFGEEA